MKKPLNKLTYLRKTNILSQKEVAEMLGISQQYYGRLEKNPNSLSVGMAMQLKSILKVKCIDELIDEAV